MLFSIVRAWSVAKKFIVALRIVPCTMMFRSRDELMGKLASGRRFPLDGPNRTVSVNSADATAGRSTAQDHPDHAEKPGKSE